MVRGYTTIEQSRKLEEILPIQSSDMYWDLLSKDKYAKVNNIGHCLCRTCVYAWSLAALLKLIPNPTLKLVTTDYWKIVWGIGEIDCDGDFENFGTIYGNTPIDAAYNTIVYLHELNLL